MSSSELCIVIPTFNRRERLEVLLKQLKNQASDPPFNVVVAVDGSTDGTFELLQSDFPEVSVIKGDGTWWFTKSLNEGCKYAVNTLNAKLILTLNDDVELPSDYLHSILKSHKECGKNSIVGSSSYSSSEPRMITFSGIRKQNKLLLKYYKHIPSFTPMEPGILKGVAKSVTLPTRGLLVPSVIMAKLGYFDEKAFPQYASDYDFVLRASKTGVNIYVSYEAYVYEHMQLTSKANPRLSPNLKSYLRNIFFNKYSSNYFFNRIRMAWRFGLKPLFPGYLMVILFTIPYTFLKYKYVINKNLASKN